MQLKPEDNGKIGIVNGQARIKQLTNELLSKMTKEELLLIIADMNAEAWYNSINTGRSDTGNITVAQFMTTYQINVDLIMSEEHHRNLDSDMYEITTG